MEQSKDDRRPISFQISFPDIDSSKLREFCSAVVAQAKEAGATQVQVDELLTEQGQPKKFLSLQELQDSGILQEVNRLFLHILGVALAIVYDANREHGELKIIDHRDSPDGIIFAEAVIDPDKALAVQREYEKRKQERARILGYVEQPVPIWTTDFQPLNVHGSAEEEDGA